MYEYESRSYYTPILINRLSPQRATTCIDKIRVWVEVLFQLQVTKVDLPAEFHPLIVLSRTHPRTYRIRRVGIK